jgi:hypothetical protein
MYVQTLQLGQPCPSWVHDVPRSGGGSGQPGEVGQVAQDHWFPASAELHGGPHGGPHGTQAHRPTSYMQLVPNEGHAAPEAASKVAGHEGGLPLQEGLGGTIDQGSELVESP